MKSSQIAALYAASKAAPTVVIDTSPKMQKPPENTQNIQTWREALQKIKDIYYSSTPQEQAEIKELLKRACN